MSSTKPHAIFWISFSLFVSGCGVPRPDTDLCVLNAQGQYAYCFNLKEDYDSSGRLKKKATPEIRPIISLHDLDKHVFTDAQGFGNLKAYVNDVKFLCD